MSDDMTEESANKIIIETGGIQFDYDDALNLSIWKRAAAIGFLAGLKAGEKKERERAGKLLEILKISRRSLEVNTANFSKETGQAAGAIDQDDFDTWKMELIATNKVIKEYEEDV